MLGSAQVQYQQVQRGHEGRTTGVAPPMNRGFAILYFINLGMLVIGVLSPIIELTWRRVDGNLVLSLYAVALALSMTLCVSFLGMNAYAFFKYPQYRVRFLCVSLLMLSWIGFGVCQIAFIGIHGIVL
jgi:hypothetical protein